MLDLIAKRIDPALITGLIIHQTSGLQETLSESFLTQVLREENPSSFVVRLTDRPFLLLSEGLKNFEEFYTQVGIQSLELYPRICPVIRKSLDGNFDKLQIIEANVAMSQRIGEIHGLLKSLLQSCIDELTKELKYYEIESQELSLANTLQKSFLALFISSISQRKALELGPKTKALLKGVLELRKLLWVLLNFDCVTFYSFLTCVLYNETSDNYFRKDVFNKLDRVFKISNDLSAINSHSFFRCGNRETLSLIDRVRVLAKERVYSFVKEGQKRPLQSTFYHIQIDGLGGGGKKKQQKLDEPVKCIPIKVEFGKLANRYKTFWKMFKEKATNEGQCKEIEQVSENYDILINYDGSPKLAALVNTLLKAEDNFKQSQAFQEYEAYSIRRLHKASKKKLSGQKDIKGQDALDSHIGKEERRKELNKSIIIAVNTMKMKGDLQRSLISYFVKSDKRCKSFMEDKLRQFLISRYEIKSREYKVSLYQDIVGCVPDVVEAYLANKLSLLLEQKKDNQNYRMTQKTGQNFKKRFRPGEGEIMSDWQREKEYGNKAVELSDIKESYLTEELIQEVEEDDYKPWNIIDGYNVICESFACNSEFELALREAKPSIIILFEPVLQFMRAIETYHAEQCLDPQNLSQEQLQVHILSYKDSTEQEEFLSTVNAEKRAFKQLNDFKQRQHNQSVKDTVSQMSFLQIQESLNSSMIQNAKKGIIAVDSREFSCLTPLYLREKGFWVVPLQLYIGDYVLSDEICVERKSTNTNDLFDSFKSGRLLQQITNMHRFYKTPVLLIEFDESVPFKLIDPTYQTDFVVGGELPIVSVISKISMLTHHFPNLQILWSTGPQHTADLFYALKNNANGFGMTQDPDLHRIIRIGKVADQAEYEADAGDNDYACNVAEEEDDFKRFMPTEFLKRLPGITLSNITEAVKRIRNIVDLCSMSEEELAKIIGAQNARDLTAFIEYNDQLLFD